MSAAASELVIPEFERQLEIEQNNMRGNSMVSGAYAPMATYQGQSKSIYLLIEQSHRFLKNLQPIQPSDTRRRGTSQGTLDTAST